MKVPMHRVEAAVSTDPDRFTIRNVNLAGDKLVATDGRILAVVPVEREDGDVDGMISTSAMASARQADKKSVRLSKKFATTRRKGHIVLHPREQEGTFPDWTLVPPKDDDKPVMAIALDAHLLVKLASAIVVNPKNTAHVKIEIWDKDRPMRVTAMDGTGAFGIIMPVRQD